MSSQEERSAYGDLGGRDFVNFASAWERTPDGGHVSVIRTGSGPPLFRIVRPEDIPNELGIPND